jgi:hypothetical protein
LLSKQIASTCQSNFVIVLIKRQLKQEASRVNVHYRKMKTVHAESL